MQIRKLIIDKYNCLENFEISFNISETEGSSTILIGENGTGKSTLLERIIEIMTSFRIDSIEEKINYGYEFEYFYKGSNITIYQHDHYYKIDINGENVCVGKISTVKRHLKEGKFSILPERISYFYSGFNNKVLKNIKRMDSLYQAECIATIVKYWRSTVWAGQEFYEHFPKRRYNYCDDDLTELYLISILSGNESFEKDYLQNQCHFDSLESIVIMLNTRKMQISLADESTNDNLSWIFYIAEFIDADLAKALEESFVHANGDYVYFRMQDIKSFDLDSITIFNFFEKLATIFETKYGVTVYVGQDKVKCEELSEGQRQLIKMLGMLGVCKTEDSLVLMDEPDAHMNPKWKYDIKETIDKSLSEAINTQAIIATHDPLVINGVQKEFIRIFTHDSQLISNGGYYHTKVIIPTESTKGLGVDGLLQSEYYGLPSVLDSETKRKMDKKHSLLVKKKDKTISEDELKTLYELTVDLENMSFARNIPTDSYYDEYVAAMHKIYSERPQVTLTAEDIAERNAKAEEILRGLLEK